MQFFFKIEVYMQGFISIHKPEGMTSFDVVRKIKRVYKTKAGHCGTLDPNATGLLIVAVGSATKALPYMGLETKVYEASLKLGLSTDTGDIWGKVLEERVVKPVNNDQIISVLKSFIGNQKQRVPMVSAKKIDGKKLYEYHRQNIEIETQYTDIEVFEIDLIEVNEDTIKFRAFVSNGTYIRTLCEDIAEKLDNIGTMSSLIRSEVGNFKLEDSIALDEVTEETELQSPKNVIALPKIINSNLEFDIMNGKRIVLDTEFDQVLLDSGTYYAVYKREDNNIFRSVRGLW